MGEGGYSRVNCSTGTATACSQACLPSPTPKRSHEKLLLSVRECSNVCTMWDRLVWQSASLLLGHINGPAAEVLERTVAAVLAIEPMAAETDYV